MHLCCAGMVIKWLSSGHQVHLDDFVLQDFVSLSGIFISSSVGHVIFLVLESLG